MTRRVSRRRSRIEAPAEEVYRWHARPGAFERLNPSSTQVPNPPTPSPTIPPVLEPAERPMERPDGLFVCGDHRDTASLRGAQLSGRRAAETVRSAAS